MVLPCCEYHSASTANEHTLTLVSRTSTSTPVGEGNHGSSSSSSIPPAPAAPPVPLSAVRHPAPLVQPPRNV
eukprot:6760390-Lingulodinium_polyedra.AAC.1